jgi:D-xylose transport system ATP-binding protein
VDQVVGEPILELRGVSKRFGAVQALTDVDFEVYAGEVVALVGDNGAGKSTLVKAIAGTGPPDSGEIAFERRPVRINAPSDATRLGIATVYQDLALCDNLDVVANLYLGREATTAGPFLDEIAMEKASWSLLRRLSVTTIRDVRLPVAAMSGGQRQAVAVARATMGHPKVVMLDEPTAALGVSQTAQVLELIRNLRAEGLGVVVISHNLNDVFAVSDRIVVLRLGQRVATFDTARANGDQVVAAITGTADLRPAAIPSDEALRAPTPIDRSAPEEES